MEDWLEKVVEHRTPTGRITKVKVKSLPPEEQEKYKPKNQSEKPVSKSKSKSSLTQDMDKLKNIENQNKPTNTEQNWTAPTKDELQLEFKVEHQLKGKNYFKSYEDFESAAKKAPIVEVDENLDAKIRNRSHTKSFDQLHNLIKHYRSYPEFRNESKLKNMYENMKNKKDFTTPIVLRAKGDKPENDRYEILSGNTRMDIAFQHNIKPKVLMIDVPSRRASQNKINKIAKFLFGK